MSRALLACLAVLTFPAPVDALPITFGSPDQTASGDGPRSIAVADFNADGDLDVAIANDLAETQGGPPGNVFILTGEADGSFGSVGLITVGHQPRAVVAGQFDADADPDLAVANFVDDSITVLPGTGAAAATFGTAATYPAGDRPRALALGQFDAGTDPDLAAANEGHDNVSVLLGGTNATFGPQTTYPVGDGPDGIAVGDFDVDGDPDLAVANAADDDVSILRGAAGGFDAKVDRQAGDLPRGVTAGDFNGDGDLDLAVAAENPDTVTVLVGGAGATFPTSLTFATGNAPRGIVAVDLTRDDDLDLVTANHQGGDVSVLVGGPGASFAAPVNLASGTGPHAVSAGDFDQDGENDLVVANLTADTFTVLLNRTPPDTTISAGPAGSIGTSSADFEFSADEPGVTFECRFNAAVFTPCSTPYTSPPVADGAHTLEVRARDPAGFVDATPASRSFSIDTTAPETALDFGPPSVTADGTPAFGFSSEAGAVFECRLDGAAFAACTSPFTAPDLPEGIHTFDVRAADGVGNVDATPASTSFLVDVTPPDTTISGGPSGQSVDLAPSFTFGASEAGSRFECSVDGSSFAACSSPLTTKLAAGPHTVAVRAIDAAGNVDATPATRSFTALSVITSRVVATARARRAFTTFLRLAAKNVPAEARVQVRCSSRKHACPFAKRSVRRNRHGVAVATRLFRRARLRPGAVVEVRVTARYAIGRVVRFKVRRKAAPRRTTFCLRPGTARPARCL